MKEFKDLKPGDWAFTIQSGWGKVIVEPESQEYPIVIKETSYTSGGKRFSHYKHPSAWAYNPFDPNDKPPVKPPKFKVDTKILVRDSDEQEWTHRHFSHWGHNDHPVCFNNGLTSWTTTKIDHTPWGQWKLPCDQE